MTSNARSSVAVSESSIEEYQTNRAVCIRKLLNDAEIESLRDGIEENFAHPSPRFKVASRSDDTGRFVEDFRVWENNSSMSHRVPLSPVF